MNEGLKWHLQIHIFHKYPSTKASFTILGVLLFLEVSYPGHPAVFPFLSLTTAWAKHFENPRSVLISGIHFKLFSFWARINSLPGTCRRRNIIVSQHKEYCYMAPVIGVTLYPFHVAAAVLQQYSCSLVYPLFICDVFSLHK